MTGRDSLAGRLACYVIRSARQWVGLVPECRPRCMATSCLLAVARAFFPNRGSNSDPDKEADMTRFRSLSLCRWT